MQKLEAEIREHNDIFVVRGADSYDNLSNKTLGLLKYTLSSPKRYTHILKTDDDTYVRVHRLLDVLGVHEEKPLMKQVYKGRVESKSGFQVFRDRQSKWYFSYDYFSEAAAAEINGTLYAAGWGYILSRDLMLHAMKKIHAWDLGEMPVPLWHNKLRMLEDVMIGVLMSDAVEKPISDEQFRAPWQGCPSHTAVGSLD